MLDLDRVDLGELRHALEDHSGDTSWWLDPETGDLHVHGDGMWDGEDVDTDYEPPHDFRRIEPIDSRESYGDLENFTARVRDPRARDLLERAIAGRGAFRRFKDVLSEFPDLRAAWFKFHDVRVERRAIEWLRDEALISEEDADRGMASRPDPDLPEISGRFDPDAIAEAVARELRELYGARLRKVVLYGSWARGDARPDSDVDLLVVLDRVQDRWSERRRMRRILYRHSLDHDTVISALPVAQAEFEHPLRRIVLNARAEGRPVA